MVLGGLVTALCAPLVVPWVIPSDLLQGWFIAGYIFVVIVMAAGTLLTLVGMQDSRTRAISTAFSVFGVLYLLSAFPFMLLGVYALYKNIAQTTASTHQTPSAMVTPPSYVGPATVAYPASVPGAVPTPASKYVAITLWSLAGFMFTGSTSAVFRTTDGFIGDMYTSLGLSGLFAIPGYIAWMLYKSATSRPLGGLTIAKRASAAVSALIVLGLVLTIYRYDELRYDDPVSAGVVVILFLLPTVVSLTITGVLYASDRSKSPSIWHIAGYIFFVIVLVAVAIWTLLRV